MRNIVVGVTGGIAAYKSADLVSKLKKQGHNVFVCMTKSAVEFVSPLTFQSLSQNRVIVDMFEPVQNPEITHISWAQRADLVVIAPATANCIGKIANGIADDFLTTMVMATKSPVMIAPAMNTNMYENTAYQENEKRLRERGIGIIEPDSGRLACGDVGKGKMAEPEKILEAILERLDKRDKLNQKHILVTAGPTIEKLDPVNYITNYSSGKMGYAIAQAAVSLGAEQVTLISGPTSLAVPVGVERISVETTDEMAEAVQKHFKDCDYLIMASAPVDLKCTHYSEHKIKKSDNMVFQFTKHQDILMSLKERRINQRILGFAAESQDIEAYAKKKLKSKGIDLIAANDISSRDTGFRSEENEVWLYGMEGLVFHYQKMKKIELAEALLLQLILLD